MRYPSSSIQRSKTDSAWESPGTVYTHPQSYGQIVVWGLGHRTTPTGRALVRAFSSRPSSMLAILSPTKTLNFEDADLPGLLLPTSTPAFATCSCNVVGTVHHFHLLLVDSYSAATFTEPMFATQVVPSSTPQPQPSSPVHCEYLSLEERVVRFVCLSCPSDASHHGCVTSPDTSTIKEAPQSERCASRSVLHSHAEFPKALRHKSPPLCVTVLMPHLFCMLR